LFITHIVTVAPRMFGALAWLEFWVLLELLLLPHAATTSASPTHSTLKIARRPFVSLKNISLKSLLLQKRLRKL
jgi:hypothetical protein